MSRWRRNRVAALSACLILLGGCASAQQNAPEDGAGAAGERTVVSTSVVICEILDELGYEQVIGVPETENALPERYQGVETVGAPMNPDLEIIKGLDPDLVLSPQTLEASLAEGYQAAGITSAFLDLSSVEGMYAAITSLGEYLGCQDEAARLNWEYESSLQRYQSQGSERVDVLLLMAFPDGFYLVATENSYVGNLVKLAGGENVYGSQYRGDENGFANINPEDMIQRDPDHILVFAHYAQEDAFQYMQSEFAQNGTWQHFAAVREGNVAYLPSEYFGMSASLDWTQALEYLAPILGEGQG